MKANVLLFILALGIAVGCKPKPAAPETSTTHQTYAVRGVIQQVPADLRHVRIAHEKIPGYMAAMTMDFSWEKTVEEYLKIYSVALNYDR